MSRHIMSRHVTSQVARRSAKPRVLFSHMLVLATSAGGKRSTIKLFLRHKVMGCDVMM